MGFWQQIIAITLTPVLVLGVLGFLMKILLQSGINRELERFKSELEIHRFQFQTRFSLIHERRMEILGEIYSHVDATERALSDLTNPTQWNDGHTREEKKQVAQSTGMNMTNYYNSKKIYLEEKLCTQIDQVLKLMNEAWIAFDMAQSTEPNEPNDKGLRILAWKNISEKLPPLKKSLETCFRQELGSSEEVKGPQT
jgi:hypothetical protein